MSTRNICIDARMIGSSGIGTYLQGLLSGFGKQHIPEFTFTLFGDPAYLPKGPWSVKNVIAPIYSLREQVRIPLELRRQQAALLHAPHYNMPFLAASHTVVTVHDLIHLKFPQHWPSLAARAYARFFFYHVIPKARAILAVSQNTKRDLMDMLSIPEELITVTYPAVDHERFQTPEDLSIEEFKRMGLPPNYLLYIGNLKEFKNIERLIDAYGLLRSRNKDIPALVLAGRNFIPGLDGRIAATSGIRWIGEVRRDLLPVLYKNALLFVFPSLYEGFGLPPLEAMASGTPVLCSNRASLPEVVGDAAVLVDPENVEEMTESMSRLIHDDELRRALSAKGLRQAAQFSWEQMANQTLRVYEKCLN